MNDEGWSATSTVADGRGLSRLVWWTITALVNAVIFTAAAAGGFRLLEVFSTYGPTAVWFMSLPEIVRMASSISLAYAAAGALARLWSRDWTTVALPAGLVFLAGLTLLATAMYFGDGGSPEMMTWQSISPGVPGVIAALVAVACAIAGWRLANFSSETSDPPSVREGAAEQPDAADGAGKLERRR